MVFVAKATRAREGRAFHQSWRKASWLAGWRGRRCRGCYPPAFYQLDSFLSLLFEQELVSFERFIFIFSFIEFLLQNQVLPAQGGDLRL